ncbi:MAG: hypothetical protein RDV48_31500 [Candidatus Eremiobacteraeota bacterium]|nr:hypothetical protein [Candidatus Eremiobacteraeota bacterium]
MFLACGIDLYEDPCPVVIMEKSGAVLEHTRLMRNPDVLSRFLQDFSLAQGHILFCALVEESGRSFPEFAVALRDTGALIKTYDLYSMIHLKNMLRDVKSEFPPLAYCLAKRLQNEALDLASFQSEIRELLKLKEALDRVLLRLVTIHAFPDDCHLVHFK